LLEQIFTGAGKGQLVRASPENSAGMAELFAETIG
jgi:hypothetical protein